MLNMVILMLQNTTRNKKKIKNINKRSRISTTTITAGVVAMKTEATMTNNTIITGAIISIKTKATTIRIEVAFLTITNIKVIIKIRRIMAQEEEEKTIISTAKIIIATEKVATINSKISEVIMIMIVLRRLKKWELDLKVSLISLKEPILTRTETITEE